MVTYDIGWVIGYRRVYQEGRQHVKYVLYHVFESSLSSSLGSWAVLQLPCCQGRHRKLPGNRLRNLFDKLPPTTVHNCGLHSPPHLLNEKT